MLLAVEWSAASRRGIDLALHLGFVFEESCRIAFGVINHALDLDFSVEVFGRSRSR